MAQIYRERHTGVGVKGGINVSGFYGSGVQELAGDVGLTTGLIAGIFIGFPIKRVFTIQPELFYSVKGAQRRGQVIDSVNDLTLGGTLKTRIAYMEIPVLLKADLLPESEFSPTLLAGPVISIMQSAKVVFKGDRQLEFPIDENVTDIDAGFVLGGGADIPFGTGHLVTEARMTFGLRSIDASSKNLSARNYTLSFMVGFEFPLIRTF